MTQENLLNQGIPKLKRALTVIRIIKNHMNIYFTRLLVFSTMAMSLLFPSKLFSQDFKRFRFGVEVGLMFSKISNLDVPSPLYYDTTYNSPPPASFAGLSPTKYNPFLNFTSKTYITNNIFLGLNVGFGSTGIDYKFPNYRIDVNNNKKGHNRAGYEIWYFHTPVTINYQLFPDNVVSVYFGLGYSPLFQVKNFYYYTRIYDPLDGTIKLREETNRTSTDIFAKTCHSIIFNTSILINVQENKTMGLKFYYTMNISSMTVKDSSFANAYGFSVALDLF